MDSAGLVIAAIFIFALGAAAGVGFFLHQQRKGEAARFFAPRSRRTAFVERTALDGGRKLLLVRRDDVEHLILVGGPIDLVVETGIRADAADAAIKEEPSVSLEARPLEVAAEWAIAQPAPSLEPAAPAEPRLSLSPAVEQSAVEPLQQQAKAAE